MGRGRTRRYLAYLYAMTRTASPFPGLAAFLAAVLLAFALGPSAAAMASALGDDDRSYCEQMGHTMPMEEAPTDTPVDLTTCCVTAPEAPRDAVVPAPSSGVERALTLALVALAPAPAKAPQTRPRDTGPPPGPRLHLALSVFLV